MSDSEFEVVSFNVHGLGDDLKRRKIFNHMKKQTSGKDIICLQETHSTVRVEKLFEYQWRGTMLFSHGTSGSKWVCIAFRYNLEYQFLNTICDTDGRYIIACVEIQDQPNILINCHAPNTESHLAEMDLI